MMVNVALLFVSSIVFASNSDKLRRPQRQAGGEAHVREPLGVDELQPVRQGDLEPRRRPGRPQNRFASMKHNLRNAMKSIGDFIGGNAEKAKKEKAQLNADIAEKYILAAAAKHKKMEANKKPKMTAKEALAKAKAKCNNGRGKILPKKAAPVVDNAASVKKTVPVVNKPTPKVDARAAMKQVKMNDAKQKKNVDVEAKNILTAAAKYQESQKQKAAPQKNPEGE